MVAACWVSTVMGGMASFGTGMPHASSASHRAYGATNRSSTILLRRPASPLAWTAAMPLRRRRSMDACPCMAWRYCSFQVPTTTSLVVRCEQGTSDVVLARLIDVKRSATTPLLRVLAHACLPLGCPRSGGVGDAPTAEAVKLVKLTPAEAYASRCYWEIWFTPVARSSAAPASIKLPHHPPHPPAALSPAAQPRQAERCVALAQVVRRAAQLRKQQV